MLRLFWLINAWNFLVLTVLFQINYAWKTAHGSCIHTQGKLKVPQQGSFIEVFTQKTSNMAREKDTKRH